VSSPGIDRPLVKPEHFQEVLGARVKIRMKARYHGRRLFDGCLTEVRDDAAVLKIDGGDCALPYAGMERANLVGADFAEAGF
jgi:ribosome maturation factor RimP